MGWWRRASLNEFAVKAKREKRFKGISTLQGSVGKGRKVEKENEGK
jgi:hypothetical protein